MLIDEPMGPLSFKPLQVPSMEGKYAQSMLYKSMKVSGEMAQGLRVCVVLVEDSNLGPQVKWFATAYKSSSRGSDALFWVP